MMAGHNMDQFDAYFRKADLDQDGRISGLEAVAFFQGSNLPQQVLAQIWTYADQNRTGFLGRAEFYNALKLVTVAQSKRELTPDMVRATLYGPASARIPPPQINLAVMTAPQPNLTAGTPVPVLSGVAPSASHIAGIRGTQGFSSQQIQSLRPSQSPLSATALQSQQGVVGRGMPGGGTGAAPRFPSSNVSADWRGGIEVNPTAGVTSQIPNRGVSPSTNKDGLGLTASGLTPTAQSSRQPSTGITPPTPPKHNDPALPTSQMGTKDAKTPAVSGNGFASESIFGDVFSAASIQPRPDSSVPPSSSRGIPVSSATVSTSAGAQPTVKPGLPNVQPVGNQHQLVEPIVKNQQVPVQSSVVRPIGAGNSSSVQPQLPWPRITQADVQKYSKVFLQVDTDRDGKITGEQARNLFLSWRLPREVLKQVWDLSDQDNDSMLSFKEFCIALYLMERYREGRPLPTVLPSSVMFDETLLPASGQPAAAYGNAAWGPTPGLQQPQATTGARLAVPAAGGKPPRPVPIPQSEETMQSSKPKPKVPVLEKHLVDQLSSEEQNSLNSKFQEATEAEKRVEQLEKEILESKEKIEFYRAKMQELVLYKSRCDNRLNEITERVSADKREVELLAKKYEDKYKQTGDVASKLTIEEATFRDIQEKKMELYRAIVKMEQDGNADGIQDRANHIQFDLEELVKALNERCKTYGLRSKPTSLVELPFGWQPGIQEGVADWDEGWDKFEDEGFTFVKELTLDVQNVTAPPKPKSSVVNKGSSSDTDIKSEHLTSVGKMGPENEVTNTNSQVGGVRSPTDSPARKNELESPSKKSQDSYRKDIQGDGSPHAAETQSEHGGAESVFSGDKNFDEPGWGAFDTHYDTDSVWDYNPSKEMDHERHSESSIFGSESWGLNPIRTGSTHTDNMFQKNSFTFDSVPSTPNYNGSSSHTANIFQQKGPLGFADSVPSTPMQKGPFGFADSVPSTPMQKGPFGFADSVPSTPLFSSGNSPRRFREGSEDHSFDTFSRFDSFNVHDGGLFPPRESFTRFDSFHSSADSDYDHGFFPQRESFTKFDSFRSTRDSDYDQSSFPSQKNFTRFDSIRSTTDTDDHGFSQPRESLVGFDSIRSTQDTDHSHESFAGHESFARFDSIHSAKNSDFSHGFASFDDTDPFGSSDPFKTSMESQTSRRDTDHWRPF